MNAIVGTLLLLAPPPGVPTAADAVRAALADVRRLDAATARHTRYLSAHHVAAAADRDELYAVTGYHVNALSRRPLIARPRLVTSWLWAVDVRDYGWTPERFGQLVFGKGAVEPYFHVQLIGGDGKADFPALAPWLPAAESAEMADRTVSQVPIVRADWLFHRTAIQEGRAGFGYYDFLELRSRADAERLAGLDRSKAAEVFREQAGVIHQSGVTLQARQVFRYATIAGAWWESRDVSNETGGRGAKNAARNLLDDYRHDAEEIVFTLPNGLPGFYLSNAAGVGVASAPPDIASDHKSTDNDRRVHASKSCVVCHTAGGLIPFADDLRRAAGPGSGQAIGSPDPDRLQRLRAVYLGPIQRAFDRDAADFGDAIERASGLKPAGLSAAVSRVWSRYLDRPVGPAEAAAEVGLPEAEFVARLARAKAANPLTDPVLSQLTARPPVPIRREHWEELFPLVMTAVGDRP